MVAAHVLRAQRAQRWRTWVERAGASAPRAPMWTSRQGWLSALRGWAHSPALAATCEAARVSMTAPTLLAIAAVMAQFADHATGRNVAITRARIAARVGCDPRTVTTAWRVLRIGRWAVEAQRGHGSPGTPSAGRRPSVYHLVPRRTAQAVHDFHLPPKGGTSSQPCVENYSPSARARATEQNFPTPNRHSRRRQRATPRPLQLQRLAAELVTRSHGLHRNHIGAVCDALTAARIDPHTWPARAIIDALNTDMQARGCSWPDRIERPGAFLASRLRRLQWRPEGPPKSGGGQAAARTEGAARADTDCRQPSPPPLVRIAAGKATARQQLAAALTGAATPTALGWNQIGDQLRAVDHELGGQTQPGPTAGPPPATSAERGDSGDKLPEPLERSLELEPPRGLDERRAQALAAARERAAERARGHEQQRDDQGRDR